MLFFRLTILAKTFSVMLIRSEVGGHSCLDNLREKANISLFSMMLVSYRVFVDIYQVKEVFPSNTENFYHEQVLNFIKYFSCIC